MESNEFLLNLLKARNSFKINDFIPVFVNENIIGFVHHENKELITNSNSKFNVGRDKIILKTDCYNYDYLTKIFQEINEDLISKNVLNYSHNGEMYRVVTNDFSTPLFSINRYAASFWGIRIFGVHLNGLVRNNSGQINMWYSQRSKNRLAAGMLDHLVCGGQPSDITLIENLYKESYEEAGIGNNLIKNAIPVGVVSCVEQKDKFLNRFTPFIFDLFLSDDFKHISNDRSASCFSTLSLNELLKNPQKIQDFKSACQPVIISLLIRFGYIKPDDKYYIHLCSMLMKGFFSHMGNNSYPIL